MRRIGFLASLFFDHMCDQSGGGRDHENTVERGVIHSSIGVLSASVQTAATFSRSDLSLIFIKGGKAPRFVLRRSFSVRLLSW
jgi:hypothetical protein